MDATEDHHALLNQGHRGTNRLCLIGITQLLKAGLHNPLAGVNHKAKQLEQHWARAVKRQRHGKFAHVINQRTTFKFHNFSRLDVESLATRATL